MTELIGFRKSVDLYAATMVVFTILFFLCNKNILQDQKGTQIDDYVQDPEQAKSEGNKSEAIVSSS